MPQPGMNGMEPVFGEAYGGHRGLLSPYPLAMSPQGGRTEYDQSVLLMLGSPASPRKRPFELLSDLVDDGGFGEDLHPERWDVSSLDEMARYTKLGLGVGGELLACSEEAVLMGRWGRSREEEEEEEERRRRSGRHTTPPVTQEVQAPAAGREEERLSVTTATGRELCVAGRAAGGGQDGGMSRERTVEVYQVAQEEEEAVAVAAAGLALEHCSEEHNYSLSQGGELGTGPAHNCQTEEVQAGETQQEVQGREESQAKTEDEEEEVDEEEDEEDDEEEEEEEGTEETAVEAELSSSSETECGELCFQFVFV
nr:PREDICTED: sodium/potassium/calcium exchanger 1-like [Paralichthys olivaceus]XP_019967499.1 PREDICTED: sodium/potassium/calcium exchanger 1-like [Paralichthys olivaceus]XP_019967501.1 PREDICTED: sodium/potassium/calcium exchanger 1-like [Paralichthys olivaceus]